MASIWEGQSEKEESLLAWRRPLHQWHQSHSPALGVLGPESVTSLLMEHPWGDKHEAKYQFTYTETVWWLRCCCTDWKHTCSLMKHHCICLVFSVYAIHALYVTWVQLEQQWNIVVVLQYLWMTHGQTVYPYGNKAHMALGCGCSSSVRGLHRCFWL
jgi:hypothetical protein